LRYSPSSAVELERLVAEGQNRQAQPKKRGAPVRQIRFATSAATVTVTFRKKNVSNAEVASALDEARTQIGGSYQKLAAA